MTPRQAVLLASTLLLFGLAATGAGQEVIDSIEVPGAWVGSLHFNPIADVVYGASEDGFFFAISCLEDSVVVSYPLRYAFAVEYCLTGNKAYCTFYRSGTESLAVIDGSTHRIVRKLEMPGATMPVWDSVGNRLYVSCQTTNKVAVVDCTTDSLLLYIPVGACPIKMHINTLRRKLYVQNLEAGTVSVIDMVTNQVVKTVAVGGEPNAGCYSRGVDRYYCASRRYVAVVDGARDTVIGQVSMPGTLWSIVESQKHGLVMAAAGDSVLAIHTGPDTVVSRLQVRSEPGILMWSAVTDLAYCANYPNTVSVIAGDGGRVLKTLVVGGSPFAWAIAPSHRRIYLGHLSGFRVLVIRDTVTGFVCEAPDPPQPGDGLIALPNPFRRVVSITGADASRVKVYSLAGKLVRTLSRGPGRRFSSGIRWDGADSVGCSVPAGVYFVQAENGHRIKVVKAR